MLWDGISFFGFDDTKLKRIRLKKKPSVTDKCSSKRWIVVSLITVILAIEILSTEINALGTQKS